MSVPFLSFENINAQIKEEILEDFQDFFDKGWYILGERVKQFEQNYASFNQVSHCIGVSNGLDALHIALKALNIGKGDEVIVPSNTYIASVLAISYVGAKPVFVEPDILTYNIDITKIEKVITSKTKAIMPVHLYGQACNMESIMEIAKKFKIYVVEDNAQSQGATFNGKLTGSWGDINGTSFYPGKNLGALGDAGAVTTNNPNLAHAASVLRNYGSSKKYHNEVEGFNMRLDECQAGFLSIKLKYLQKWTEERQQIGNWYSEALKDINAITLPKIAKGATHVYHLYVIRINDRNNLQQHLTNQGIGTLIHYPIPPHLQTAYKYLNYKKGDFPIAEEIAETCLSLPLWPGITFATIEEICTVIKKYYK